MFPQRAAREEFANTATHGFAVLASLVGGAVLIAIAARLGDVWRLVGAATFSFSLVLLYSASTLYHGARSRIAKARLRILDHAAIYVLIAGTYTPFTLTGLRGRLGWTLFGVIWALAAAGVVFKLFATGRFPRLSTGIYLAMGWLAVVAIGPLMEALPASILLWLLGGGLAYTVGTAFFHSRRIPYAHTIWHLFVLLGSVCHFVAVTMQITSVTRL